MPDRRSHGQAQLQQMSSLIRLEEDPLLGNAFAEHFVLGFEELVVPSQLRFRGPGKEKQQWLEDFTHAC